MRKTLYYILLILIIPFHLQAESISIFDVNTEDYPNIKAKVLALDKQSKPLLNMVASDYEIFENGKSRFVNSLQCNNLEPDTTVSLIISIDVSESMSGKSLDIAKNSAINLIESIDLLNSEVAIQTFNEQNSINQDFTNQKNKLIDAIKNIKSYGGTNFNASFLDLPAGSVRIAKRASYKPIIIVISDGIAEGNESEIIDSVYAADVTVYSITIATETPEILKNVSMISGGNSFENINSVSNLSDIFKVIFSLSQGIEPCEIAWTSGDCESIREVECSLRNTAVSNFNYYKLPTDKFLGFEYEDNNYLEFGTVPVGNDPVQYISIKAANQDIRVSSISSNNNLFKIVGLQNGTLFEKGKPIQIAVQFSPENEEYETAEFTINANICFGYKFYASGGDKYNIGDKKLKIDSPNGGEILLAQSDTIISWSGLIPSDIIELQYSNDNGSTWNLLSSSASGLNYKWKNIPKTSGDDYLVKAIQYSNEKDDSQILKISQTGSILNLIWNDNDDKVLISDASGLISNYEINTQQEELLFGNLSMPEYTAISDISSLIAYTDSESIKVFNINTGVPFADLSKNGELFSNIQFSPDGLFLSAVSSSGNLLIWRLSDRKLIFDLAVDVLACNDYAWFAESKTIISAGKSGSLRIWQVSDRKLLNEIIDSGDEIKDLSLSNNGFSVAIISELNNIDIYDISTNIKVTSFKGFQSEITRIEYSPDIDYFLEVSSGNQVAIRTTKNINNIWQIYDIMKDDITAFSWAANSNYFAIGNSGGGIHIVPLEALPLKKIILQEDVSDSNFSVIVPNLQLKRVDFGEQKLNTARDSIVISFIENTSKFDILVDSIYFTGSHISSFSVNSDLKNNVIKANISLPVEFIFSPKELGLNSAMVNVATNIGVFSNQILGKGLPADTLLIAQIIDFGMINIGETYDSLAVVLDNVSSEEIILDSISIIGPDYHQFRYDEPTELAITAGAKKSMTLYFQPKELGRTSTGLAFYINGFTSPVITNLFGEGTAPKIEYDSLVQRNVVCSPDENVFAVDLFNSGNGIMKINEINISGDDYLDFYIIEESTDYELPPLQSGKITLALINYEVSNYKAELNIKTNLNSNFKSDFKIEISVQKDSLGAIIDRELVELINLDKNQDYFDTLYITNTGSLPIQFDEYSKIGQFEIVSIEPLMIEPNQSAEIILKFNAVQFDGEYSADLPIIKLCDRDIFINAKAYVGVNLSELTITKYPQFDKLYCYSDRDTSSLIIRNTGKSPFRIFESIILDDNLSFNLLNDVSDIVLMPENELELFIEFSPKSLDNNSILQIYSNAANINSEFTEVILQGNKYSSEFNLESFEIIFDNVLNNFSDSAEIEISNNGEYAQNFQFSVNTGNFNPENNSLNSLGVNEKQKIKIFFNGGEAGNIYYDTLFISNQCGEIAKISLIANVRGYAQVGLRTGEFSSAPGEIISIPIMIYSPENIDLPQVDSYSTTICFNKNLLYPLSDNIGEIFENLRCIELEEIIYSGASTLAELEFYTMRGDDFSTEIILKNSIALDTFGISIEEQTGLFKLELSDSTMIASTGKLILEQNNPNPAINETEINFYAIENGRHIIFLTDYLGRIITILFDEEIEYGQHSLKVNTEKYSQGFYIYKLITPSHELNKKMLIIK